MSSLRRDLFERRLWPVILVLAIAVVAVPFVLLRRHSDAQADTVPIAPMPVATSTTSTTPATPVKTLRARQLPVAVKRHLMQDVALRNPFVATHLADHPSYSKNSTTSTASSSTTASSSATPTSSTTSTGTMVSPAPASEPTTSTDESTGTGRTPETSVDSATVATARSGATTTKTVTTTASSTAEATTYPATGKWTIYSADVEIGASGKTLTPRTNVVRLSPLPSAADPKVMFAGVTTGGEDAVFLLGAGVKATGPALCRPDHARCSAIDLPLRRAETLTVPADNGTTRTLKLEVTRIGQRVTHSEHDALAAFKTESAAGVCELALAEPYSFEGTTGTLSSAIPSSCRHSTTDVPFPSAVN